MSLKKQNVLKHFYGIPSVLLFAMVIVTCICSISKNLYAGEITQAEKLEIADVWAGNPVNFAIKTKNDFQCVAYYNPGRKMVIAARTVDETAWEYTELPTTTGWDTHNYIDCAIDDSGYIHISGNMHNVNLIYFRSKKPWSIEAFEQPGMVGSRENSVTYPVFIEGPERKLLFQYRIGGSGDGVTIWNGYDLEKKKWYRITDKGLFDRAGSVNAYSTPPALGPDNCFHIVWMWRDSPVANTNHGLSHMKSSDLINWQNMAGKPVSIPVSQYNTDVVVDPIGSGHGLINMDFWISWDTQDRAVVTYHRYNDKDVSQIFNTRWEDDHWKIYQTSSWTNFRWYLDLQGSLTHDIAATPLSIDENGELVQNYVYRNQDIRRWILDETTLKPNSDDVYRPPEAMEELYTVESDFPDMQANWVRDGEYYIKWESMPINQDRARSPGTYPPSSTLRLYKFSTPTQIEMNRYSVITRKFTIDKNRFRIVVSNSLKNASIPFHVVLYSLDGNKIYTTITDVNNCCVIPIISMPRGVYILRIIGESGTSGALSERIVIK